jgi:nucleoside-diphosphate-sugar epimerase
MRILVVGAGRTGAHVLCQLQKNPELTVIVVDPHKRPYAVEQGIISSVDFRESLTPLTLDYLLQKSEPDLILLTRAPRDLGVGSALGLDMLANSLQDELVTISDVPMIVVSQASIC